MGRPVFMINLMTSVPRARSEWGWGAFCVLVYKAQGCCVTCCQLKSVIRQSDVTLAPLSTAHSSHLCQGPADSNQMSLWITESAQKIRLKCIGFCASSIFYSWFFSSVTVNWEQWHQSVSDVVWVSAVELNGKVGGIGRTVEVLVWANLGPSIVLLTWGITSLMKLHRCNTCRIDVATEQLPACWQSASKQC